MKRRTFLKGTLAAGASAATGPFVLRRTAHGSMHGPLPDPGPDEKRILESAKKLRKNVDLSFVAWGSFYKGAMEAVAANFKKETGIGIGGFVDVGFAALAQRAMAEALGRSGKLDLLHVHMEMIPTLVAAGLATPLDDYMKAVNFNYTTVGKFREMSQVEGKTYGLVTDGNCHTYLVRKDILENPDNQKRYADKYGVPLKMATTWKEYLQQGAFFGSDPSKLSGFGSLRARRWGFWWFLINYYNHGLFPFTDDLEPNFDNDVAEAALEAYLAEKGYYPRDIDNWGTAQMWTHGAEGRAYQSIYWGGILPVWEDKQRSKSAGKWLHGPLPANVLRDGRRLVRTIAAGPPVLIVNRWGKDPEAAAHLAMYWNALRNSTYLVQTRGSSHEPWRPEHLTDPVIRQRYTPEAVDAFKLNMQVNSPSIRVTGALEFIDLLDKNISDAWLGILKPRQALKRVQEDWKDVILRIGKERLKGDVESYKKSMPDVDVPVVR